MIQWFLGEEAARPVKIDRAQPVAGAARLVAGFGAGSVVLHGPRGDVSLVWEPGTEDRERSLPPGSYELRTARLEKVAEGVHWFVSTTAAKGPKLELAAGKRVDIGLGPTVVFRGTAKRVGAELRLGFSIQDPGGRGLSVYKSYARVPVRYSVHDRDGKVLTQGTMRYG